MGVLCRFFAPTYSQRNLYSVVFLVNCIFPYVYLCTKGTMMIAQQKKYGFQHYCVNLPDGGHRCMCHHGYNLASNGRHCEGVIPRLNLKFMRFIFISPEPSPRPLMSCFKGTNFLFSCLAAFMASCFIPLLFQGRSQKKNSLRRYVKCL